MNRLYPERSYGRYVCCDHLNHEWFFPVIKVLVHSIKNFVCRAEKIDQSLIQVKPTFPQNSEQPKITWLGHSTFLIQVAGKNILTDPIFDSLSLVFKRLIPAVVTVSDLPRIDYVLISHNHFDHMDSKALLQIKEKYPAVKCLVPMGDKDWFDRHLFAKVSEHMWWDEIVDTERADLKFTFLPANHWSQRTLFDKNRSLWGSWMIQGAHSSIYFAGDTSWGLHFKQIGQEFKQIDVALLPIAPGEPESWMKYSHINAVEAVRAFIDLKATTLIPMHWGTYQLGFDAFFAPVQLLQKSWKASAQKLQHKKLKILKFGELFADVSDSVVFNIAEKFKQISL